ncbi:MAG TPA: hypothetical protein VEI95_02050 [Acidobacteriota bacterium]|nr:hypothetical protein [Acidobacteriota bacterium]
MEIEKSATKVLIDDAQKSGPETIAHHLGCEPELKLSLPTGYPSEIQEFSKRVAAFLAKQKMKLSNGSDPLLSFFPILSSVHAAQLRLSPFFDPLGEL